LNLSFSRNKRLLATVDFNAVFSNYDYKSFHPTLLVLAKENLRCEPRLGLVIGKKNIKFAVQRNRVKRQLREFFRLNQIELNGLDMVFVARKGLADLNNAQIRINIKQLIHKVTYKRHKKITTLN